MLCPYDNLVFKYVFHPNDKRCKAEAAIGWAEHANVKAEALTRKTEALTGCAKHANVKAEALTRKAEALTGCAKHANVKAEALTGKAEVLTGKAETLTFNWLYFTSDVNYPNQRNIKNYPSCRDVALQRLYN
ncbi:hypothetical protein NIES25_15320 [Nostoc linckia NIES-25]|nr:hypothetical protein NIES25_15320 [Nostoc linckia NIES-25]